ncbi:MAG: hydroxymethylpyrimidine/phosphomethylpyrimidine kinase [Deltaproteobacteria bacterium]
MGRGKAPPVILAFGGFDPTGGAGVLMDARAVHAAGGYAAAVPSCLAVQTTASFDRIVPVAREALDRSLACAAEAFRVRAVKVGMVGTRAAAEAILGFVAANPALPVVVDPVLRSSAGVPLMARAALPAYRRLLRHAAVVTPNLPEASKILDRTLETFRDAVAGARDIAAATGAAVVLKGGHFPWPGKRGTDIVFEAGRVTLLPGAPFPRGRDPHGTGCALAAAIAARIALGDPLLEAVRRAKDLVARMAASGFPSAEGRWTLYAP